MTILRTGNAVSGKTSHTGRDLMDRLNQALASRRILPFPPQGHGPPGPVDILLEIVEADPDPEPEAA